MIKNNRNDSKIYLALGILIFTILQLADLYFTKIFIFETGMAIELNPIIQFLYDNYGFGSVTTLKLIATIVLISMVIKIYTKDKKYALITLLIGNIIMLIPLILFLKQ